MLFEHAEVAYRRGEDRGEEGRLGERHFGLHAAGDSLPLDGVHAQHIDRLDAVLQNPDRVAADHRRARAAPVVNSCDPHSLSSVQIGAEAVMMTALRVASGSIGSEWSCSHFPTRSDPSTMARQRS